jgi:hypothetical protein
VKGKERWGGNTATYLGRGRHHAERAECVIKQPFIHIFVQGAYEEIRAHVELLLVRRGLHDSAETMEFERVHAPCQEIGIGRPVAHLVNSYWFPP